MYLIKKKPCQEKDTDDNYSLYFAEYVVTILLCPWFSAFFPSCFQRQYIRQIYSEDKYLSRRTPPATTTFDS